MAARKQRVRSPHPGVVLLKPSGEHVAWRARYVDPDTGKMKKERLNPLTIRTAEARRAWAITKSKQLAMRRLELEGGAPKRIGTSVQDMIDAYLRHVETQLRPRTHRLYKMSLAKFATWADRVGVRSADELTRERLVSYPSWLASQPKKVPKRGGKPREWTYDATQKNERSTVNRDLVMTRLGLNWARRAGMLARLTSDDVRDALRPLKVEVPAVEFLRSAEIRALLEAAIRHDARKFRGRAQAVPLVCVLLFGGLRVGEAVLFEWRDVRLDAREIALRPEIVKTGRARVVDLGVSPALVELLDALQPLPKPAKARDDVQGFVLGITLAQARSVLERLSDDLGTSITAHTLRRTCGTYLTNAPGIFGAASAYRSAKQLGHGVQVAEKLYVGLVRGIPVDARDLESAMRCDDLLERILSDLRAR